jgi:acetyl-CoA carboxylase carboxyl transferase subunit alpha
MGDAIPRHLATRITRLPDYPITRLPDYPIPLAHLLDFEKPLADLEAKLRELRRFEAEDGTVDLTEQIQALERRVESLRQSIYRNLTRWQRVQLARHPDRPYTLDYIGALTEDFVELHGDRLYGDDRAMVGGLATFRGSAYGGADRSVLVLGHQKGRDTRQRKERRFGMPNPEGYRKARRMMEMAARFGNPIITFLDTPGAYPGLEAEERGQAEAIARNLFVMARLPVPIVIVVIGEGASGGALGIGVGDRILMLENAWYSVISPESCSSILWRNWDHKEDAARALRLTASDLLQQHVIDEILEEPIGGAHRDPGTTYDTVGRAIARHLDELERTPVEQLLTDRLAKFDAMGAWEEVEDGAAT